MSNPTSISLTFGSWLKQRRRRLELTQLELAHRVPCAEVTIRKLESGAIRPGRELAERLAECLKLSPAEREQFVLVGRGLATPTFTPGTPPSVQPRHNLLEPPTAIIGREAELAALRERLLHQTVRLLTITGTGGVGKTRLLREVALQVQDNFQDGVYFVELASVTEAGLVVPTIVRVLGLGEDSSTPPLEMLKAFLESRHLLLLLDNFEHVLPAAPNIGVLVRALPRLKVVVTSRERLNLAAEQEFLLSSLPSPPTFEEDPSSYAAVRLFVERAQAANPEFTLNRANRAAVAELCTRLDGLPLAIELAAVRSKLLGPRALLARLHDRFALLNGGVRDLPTRHQSLRATLDWSYQLLTGTEQQVLARLGVFMGGATLEAAETVCRSKKNSSLLDGIASLVDKSLVKQVETENGEPRLLLLETVRVYAIEQLETMGILEETHQRHFDYFLGLAEQGEIGLRCSTQAQWLGILKAETANIRAALSWCLESPERVEAGLRLAGTLVAFWEYGRLHLEGYQWVDRLLKAGGTPDPAVQVKAMNTAGFLRTLQWDISEARQMVEASRALRERTAIPWGRGEVIWFMSAATVTGDEDVHLRIAEEGLAIFRGVDDPWGLALAKWLVAFLRGYHTTSQAADFERGRMLLHECEVTLNILGDRWSLVWPSAGFASIATGEGNFPLAYSYWKEALKYAREGGSSWLIDVSIVNMANLAKLMGDLQRYKVLCELRYEESQNLISARRAGAIEELGIAERELHHYSRAITLIREAVEFAHRYQMLYPLLHCLYELFDTIVAIGNFPDDVPPESFAEVARAVFGTLRLSLTYEEELWIYAATLIGVIAAMLNDEQIRFAWSHNEWFLYPLHVERHLKYETFHKALRGGYFMTREQAVAYALNQHLQC